MKCTIKISLAILAFTGYANNGFSQIAREIAEKSSNVINFTAMEMTATLKIMDAQGRERTREIASATSKFNGITKTIMKFTAPADVKGTAMLIYDYEKKDDDMWIYMPALRKNRRIVSNEKGKSFMGSEFTNADMGKPILDDFNYKILKEETYNGKTCWVVEAICKNEDVEDANGFKRQVSWIEKGTYLCQKVEYYDLDNELEKIQYIKDYRKQSNGIYFAFYLEKKNVQTGRKSIMTINKFQGNSTMPESAFSPNVLGQ